MKKIFRIGIVFFFVLFAYILKTIITDSFENHSTTKDSQTTLSSSAVVLESTQSSTSNTAETSEELAKVEQLDQQPAETTDGVDLNMENYQPLNNTSKEEMEKELSRIKQEFADSMKELTTGEEFDELKDSYRELVAPLSPYTWIDKLNALKEELKVKQAQLEAEQLNQQP
jgi:uncharacterized membrane protein YcgQ (UPF0703/DUF1980 family)